nr:hypothetical protein CKG001_10580 [Bdellovibrio sp. CKG001]BFD63181.1 hypothetical protein BdHM001_18620 [Bdellovibrio sp. HM001]
MSGEVSALKETQVFTPRWAADEMLDLLDKELFGSEETFFFEPSCGDGAILIPMLDRIFASLLAKHSNRERALAETLHKFYAIELDEEMVIKCRTNVWGWISVKLTEGADQKVLLDFLIANQLRDAIEHNNFFQVMQEAEDTAVCRRSKRLCLMKYGARKL